MGGFGEKNQELVIILIIFFMGDSISKQQITYSIRNSRARNSAQGILHWNTDIVL